MLSPLRVISSIAVHSGRPRVRPGWRRLSSALIALVAACSDPSGPGGGGETGTLTGTVRATANGAVIAGATVSVGSLQATSGADGRYELANIPVGTVTARATRAGYGPVEASVLIGEGTTTTQDFSLTVQEIYVSGADAAYVPSGVGRLRGVIITLGGPVTSGFVTGGRIAPTGYDPLEVSLQSLGASLRNLARTARVALIGRTPVSLPDTPGSDALLLQTVRTIAELSGHPELEDAPIMLYGLSSGAREASGFVSRQPDRVAGVVLRVPVGAAELTAAAALQVPTFVMQAENDGVADNLAIRTTFAGNRSRGGRWALAVEPGVGHSEASGEANTAGIAWMSAVLGLRLPATAGAPMTTLAEPSGWLGNQTTHEIASWDLYTGTRSSASWLPTQQTAITWQALSTGS